VITSSLSSTVPATAPAVLQAGHQGGLPRLTPPPPARHSVLPSPACVTPNLTDGDVMSPPVLVSPPPEVADSNIDADHTLGESDHIMTDAAGGVLHIGASATGVGIQDGDRDAFGAHPQQGAASGGFQGMLSGSGKSSTKGPGLPRPPPITRPSAFAHALVPTSSGPMSPVAPSGEIQTPMRQEVKQEVSLHDSANSLCHSSQSVGPG
jgi:hypothetical protein